jgi:tellurium resistance protein TerD
MGVNLQKGQRVSLDKGMRMALIGLGWDPNLYDGGYDFDLDASAFVLRANGKVASDEDFIFYNNPDWHEHTIWSTGDDRTGGNSEEGDDEQIFIDFSKVPSDIDKIAITVTIYDAPARKQNFGQVSNAYIRLVNDETGEEILRFDLNEDFSIETAVVFAELYRKDGEWRFNAVGSGFQDGLAGICNYYNLATEG